TAFGAVPDAVAALKEGATDYLTKPFRLDELKARVEQISKSRLMRKELAWARATMEGEGEGTSIVGRSPALQRALERIETFAHSDYPVLITGESGTGKELVARLLHEHSERSAQAMIAVNCAAFPETLIEAELFGYKRGAFTGAFQDREGRFKAANGGTLFLDEVAEIPLPAQAKLLRVLQEGCFEPLGTNQSVRVDVRIISATHRDLRDRVRTGLFREDLYYRLKVLRIDVPPLRDRRGDLPVLVEHFLRRFRREDGTPGISARAMAALAAYSYPGNVRELEHAIQHAGVLARGRDIDVEHLPPEIAGNAAFSGSSDDDTGLQPLPEAIHLFEREYLVRALQIAEGKRTRAAHMLGISRKNLWQKLRRHGLLDFSPDASEPDDESMHTQQ
ncbi:MAG TPA: sigma-54 dependent transcriptional regulator, partial [Myxococcota bacterium]|nr:sigma-54 dependent transcriptional regulator [Myxococcota bacterium]